ncbi:Nitrilase/cyanide hydratase and apolipoprotein N-acyltransferase family protein, partial [Dorcoceras hygrometricum]
QFKIGLCQLSVNSDKNINISNARSSIQSASKQGAILVLLPEMWNCPYSTDYFTRFSEDFDDKENSPSDYFTRFSEDFDDKQNSPSYSMLSDLACREGIIIVGGSVPERCGDRLYNTCCVFGPNGELLAKHRKLHMFDVYMTGDISFKESSIFLAGEEPTIVNTDVGRIGIGICHGLRFPELAMVYRERGAHLLCYPGAFNMSTGEALWELEQRARQLYVATCSPARDSAGSYTIWGHSTVVNPVKLLQQLDMMEQL